MGARAPRFEPEPVVGLQPFKRPALKAVLVLILPLQDPLSVARVHIHANYTATRTVSARIFECHCTSPCRTAVDSTIFEYPTENFPICQLLLALTQCNCIHYYPFCYIGLLSGDIQVAETASVSKRSDSVSESADRLQHRPTSETAATSCQHQRLTECPGQATASIPKDIELRKIPIPSSPW